MDTNPASSPVRDTPPESCSAVYPLKTCSTDVSGLWRLSDLMVQLQEAAVRHCDLLGCGRIPLLREFGAVWVLTRNEIHIHRTPALGETVTVETFPGPVRRTIFPRYFIVRDSEGNIAADSASYWVLCSAEDRRMVFLPEVAAMVPAPDRTPPFTRFTSPSPIRQEGRAFVYRPVYCDLDINGHVNNTRYADWLCNALGTDFMRKNRIVSFLIDYHHEVLPDMDIRLELKTDESAFSLTGTRQDTLFFDISGRYVPAAERTQR